MGSEWKVFPMIHKEAHLQLQLRQTIQSWVNTATASWETTQAVVPDQAQSSRRVQQSTDKQKRSELLYQQTVSGYQLLLFVLVCLNGAHKRKEKKTSTLYNCFVSLMLCFLLQLQQDKHTNGINNVALIEIQYSNPSHFILFSTWNCSFLDTLYCVSSGVTRLAGSSFQLHNVDKVQ